MVDRYGLLTDEMPNLQAFQQPLVQKKSDLQNWESSQDYGLEQVIREAKITVLIGVSGQPDLFTQEVVEDLCKNTKQPIILPLSNPTSRVEATPQDIFNWSEGNAIVATGSPFAPVLYKGQQFEISQCNNSYIFPGIGLGVLIAQATSITDNMLMAASQSLADASMQYDKAQGALLPALGKIKAISKSIAYAVAQQAITDGVASPISQETMQRRLAENFWEPKYRDYRRTSF